MPLATPKDDPPQSSPVPVASNASLATTLELSRTDPNLGINFDGTGLFRMDGEEAWTALDNIAALGLTTGNDKNDSAHSTGLPNFSIKEDDLRISSPPAGPFHKWMKSLHKKAHRPKIRGNPGWVEPFPEYSEYSPGDGPLSPDGHRKSSSGSSYGFVAAVRSASVSLASASVVTRPRRHTGRSSLQGKTDLSSRGSTSGPRCSEDSVCCERTVSNDPAVTERLLQRRRILEEIINTEESYIGDVKFLMNVYVTILASLPSPHMGLRSSINRNLTDIVELHEEILGELHRVVPNSEYTQPERISVNPDPASAKKHRRWLSLDSVPEERGGTSWLQNIPSVIAEPTVAAEVAHVFGKRINRFFVYEEYGAKYEMMIKDVASAHRTMPEWETYQKGLEALASSLGAANSFLDHSRKSLTISDLLVKPIQRICRYPLLFAELLKYTPVCDCPSSHMEIENALIRLREATAEMNRATDNPRVKTTMEQTWLLQDRLAFPHQKLDAACKTTIRSFGQVRLCGALHVCWQTRDGVDGAYMVTLLYRDCLCLATTNRPDQTYTIQACIGLGDIKVEEVDNGRGLQCHTAPFSWKLVFECDHQLYEIIMTACSPKEEAEWRSRLGQQHAAESHEMSEPAFYSSIYLNIKSLGTIFGKPGTVARRLSIQRATTVGPKSALCQVILKNTSTVKDTTSAAPTAQINRSQSLLTTNTRIPVIAPSRGDRARLEALLADVWSRKILPFPGITSRSRSEYLVRSSASTVMRKLSVASITNSFAKRSASAASVTKLNGEGTAHVNSVADNGIQLGDEKSSQGLVGSDSAEGSLKRRLPMIRDEAEHTRSDAPSISSSHIGARSRREKIDVSELDLKWLEDEHGFSTSALRLSPSNSNNRKRQSSLSAMSSPCSISDEEAIYQGLGTKHRLHRTLTNVRPASKWPRVGGINRGGVASSIRSFFR
ncbi:Dbl homology domain-containing protein [Hypoxylon sp. FL1284]|nr:Dbl homology domain-containing protein [Hypoxylon sp. FL1284]